MKRFVLLFFIAVLSGSGAWAQGGSFDAALDRYESICRQCIDLRTRAQAGEAVSPLDLTALLTQLSDLRHSLQEAGGKMSPAQKLRFYSIRLRYEEQFSAKSRPRPQLPAVVPPATAPAVCAGFSDGKPSLLGRGPFRQYHSFGSHPSQVQRVSSPLVGRTAAFSKPQKARAWYEDYVAAIFVGLPDDCVGGMAAFYGGRFGGYIKNGYTRRIPSSFSCLSDGTLEEGGYIWTTGREYAWLTTWTLGAVYRVWPWLTVYAGGGYGFRNVLWESASGEWAKVSDLSARGVTLDAGILVWVVRIPLGTDYSCGIHLVAGVSDIAFRHPMFDFGLGLSF